MLFLSLGQFEIKYKIETDDVTDRAECKHTLHYQRLTFADIIMNELHVETPDVKTFVGNLLTGVIIKPWKRS